MKPALVLGLALAANALTADQYDNELIVAPTDQFGNIKKYPGHIMFDEQADDELLVRPISTYVADDELIVAPTDEFGRIKHYPPYIRFDEDGNEFFAAPTHRVGEIGHRILYDNELAARVGEMKEVLGGQMEHKRRLDDEDNELMMAPYRVYDDLITRKVYDDEADTELMRAPYQKRRYDDIQGRKVYDDEVDAELMMAPLEGTGKYSRKRFDDVTTRKVYDDEADTELMGSPWRRRFEDREGKKVIVDNELMRSIHRNTQSVDDELMVRRQQVRHENQQVDDELMMMRRQQVHRNTQNVDDELDELNEVLALLMRLQGRQTVDNELMRSIHRNTQSVDDELLVRPTRHYENQHVDDELMMMRRQQVRHNTQSVDDELIVTPNGEFTRIRRFPIDAIYNEDDEFRRRDDELMVKADVHRQNGHVGTRLFVDKQAEALRRDDELMVKTDSQPDGVGTRLFITRQAEALRRRDDEELFRRPVSNEVHPHAPTMGPKLFVERQAQALRRDDEGDDELVYLADLLKNHKMDRFRDHELPEIKGRKPLTGGFLPVN
jgi:hypothetical protein